MAAPKLGRENPFTLNLNIIPVGIVFFEFPKLNCVFQNSAARTLLGVKDEADVSKTRYEALFVTDYAPNKNFSPGAVAEGFSQEAYLETIDGRRIFVQASYLLKKAAKNFAILVFHDITKRKTLQRDLEIKQRGLKEAYDELMKSNDELRKLDVAKDRFLALVTHELRTPLTAVLTSAELLRDGIYNNEKDLEFLHTSIISQARSLSEIVNDVLDVTKIRTGKMEFYVSEQNIVPMVTKLTLDLMPVAEKNGSSIDISSVPAEIPAYVDEVRFNQVVTNLLSNAIKFNKPGKPIHIRLSTTDEMAVIEVEDHGIGIPASKKEAVFDEFETLEEVSKHHKGTGLGLPISRGMVVTMGGTLTFESIEGKGSTFRIEIPRTKVLQKTEVYRQRRKESFNLLDDE